MYRVYKAIGGRRGENGKIAITETQKKTETQNGKTPDSHSRGVIYLHLGSVIGREFTLPEF